MNYTENGSSPLGTTQPRSIGRCELNLNFGNFTPGELRSSENVRTYRLMGTRTLRGLRFLIYNALRNFGQRLVSSFFLFECLLQQRDRIV